MGHDWIDERASSLAYGLDHGDGAQVAKQLREDCFNMNERDFASLVHKTQAYERPGYGDDLQIRDVAGGQAVSVESIRRDRNGPYRVNIPAGEIEFPPIYDEPREPRGPVGGNRDISGRDVLIGAVIGAVIEHQIDNHRDRHRDNRRRDDHHRDHDRDDRRRYPHDNRRR